mgnify:CR=1 FL=1
MLLLTAAMPLKPMAGTEDWVHCHCSKPVRKNSPAPRPEAYLNVNEVISSIMLNWISLYLVNMLLSTVKELASP